MRFDENFLAEVGISNLEPVEKEKLLSRAEEILEMKVGEKISEGLTAEQLVEFEGIMDNDQEVIRRIVFRMKTDFREDPVYKKLLERHGVTEGTWEILDEYLSVKWIQENRPDYREIVEAETEQLKNEIRQRGISALSE
ncbi:MAG: DUF5663 domain-containing protein [Candidatus Saccharibacteria bacterium]|nr:DUF5663 domain-containing protein [Candidatus Saccharibacteria bacterium]